MPSAAAPAPSDEIDSQLQQSTVVSQKEKVSDFVLEKNYKIYLAN